MVCDMLLSRHDEEGATCFSSLENKPREHRDDDRRHHYSGFDEHLVYNGASDSASSTFAQGNIAIGSFQGGCPRPTIKLSSLSQAPFDRE